jgi:hypothetical protein
MLYQLCCRTNRNAFKKNVKWKDDLYFLTFFDEVAANLNALFGLLKPLLEGHGKVLSGDVSGTPFLGLFEALLAQRDAHLGLLHPPEQEKVDRCQNQ